MTQESNKRIAKNTIFLYSRMAIILVVSLYTTRRLLQVIGVEDYGIYNVVCGFVFLFAFLNNSFSAAIQRFYNHEYAKDNDSGIQRVYVSSILIQILLAVVICSIVESFGYWYLNSHIVIPPERLSDAINVFHLSVISMSLTILQVPYLALIISRERMDYYAYVGIIDVLLKLVAVVLLPYIPHDKLVVYAFIWMVISVINFLLYFIYVKFKFCHLVFKWKFYPDLIKSMFGFTLWNTIGAFSLMIRNQGLNLLLNNFFGVIVNASRGIAFQVQSALLGFVTNFSTAARPQIVESYSSGDLSRSYSLFLGISKLSFILLYIMALPIAVEMDYILHVWLGSIPDYATQFTVIVLCTALIDVLNNPLTAITNAVGVVKRYNIITSTIGVLVLPVSYFVLKIGAPPVSVFITSFICSILVQYYGLRNLTKISDFSLLSYRKVVVTPILKVLVLTLPVPLLIRLLLEPGFSRFVILTTLTIPHILLVSYLIVFTPTEKALIKSIIKRKGFKQSKSN